MSLMTMNMRIMMTKFYLYDNEYDAKALSLVMTETMTMTRKTSASPFLTDDENDDKVLSDYLIAFMMRRKTSVSPFLTGPL